MSLVKGRLDKAMQDLAVLVMNGRTNQGVDEAVRLAYLQAMIAQTLADVTSDLLIELNVLPKERAHKMLAERFEQTIQKLKNRLIVNTTFDRLDH